MQLTLFDLPEPARTKPKARPAKQPEKHPCQWPLHLIGVDPRTLPANKIYNIVLAFIEINGEPHLAQVFKNGHAFALCGIKPGKDWRQTETETHCQGCLDGLKMAVEIWKKPHDHF